MIHEISLGIHIGRLIKWFYAQKMRCQWLSEYLGPTDKNSQYYSRFSLILIYVISVATIISTSEC